MKFIDIDNRDKTRKEDLLVFKGTDTSMYLLQINCFLIVNHITTTVLKKTSCLALILAKHCDTISLLRPPLEKKLQDSPVRNK